MPKVDPVLKLKVEVNEFMIYISAHGDNYGNILIKPTSEQINLKEIYDCVRPYYSGNLQIINDSCYSGHFPEQA